MSNVVHFEDKRKRHEAYEQQRRRAADAMRLAAVEFRKLEAFARQGPER